MKRNKILLKDADKLYIIERNLENIRRSINKIIISIRESESYTNEYKEKLIRELVKPGMEIPLLCTRISKIYLNHV